MADKTAVKVTGSLVCTLEVLAERVVAVLANGLGSATRRTRLPPCSETNSGPEGETTKPIGRLRGALVAGPPSPLKQQPGAEPLPAIVQIKPVDASIIRTRKSAESMRIRFPEESKANWEGTKFAFDAGI